jgi:hypothetical protein
LSLSLPLLEGGPQIPRIRITQPSPDQPIIAIPL